MIGIAALAIGLSANACSPSYLDLQIEFQANAIALRSDQRQKIHDAFLSLRAERSGLEFVVIEVYYDFSERHARASDASRQLAVARGDYVRAILEAVKISTKIHVGLRQMRPDIGRTNAIKNRGQAPGNFAELQIAHFKPCQCRINMPMHPPPGCS